MNNEMSTDNVIIVCGTFFAMVTMIGLVLCQAFYHAEVTKRIELYYQSLTNSPPMVERK